MAKRSGACHVATIKTKGKGDTVYTSHLLRRSYRDAQGKVRHENLGVKVEQPAASANRTTVSMLALGETV